MTTRTSGCRLLNLRTRPSMVRPSGPLNMFQKRIVTAPPGPPPSPQPGSASDAAAVPAAARNARRARRRRDRGVGSAGALPLYVSLHHDDCEVTLLVRRRVDRVARRSDAAFGEYLSEPA